MKLMRDILLIMKDLSELTSDIFHLQIEHAAKIFKRTLSQVLGWLLLVLVAIFLAMIGLGWMLYSLYLQLSSIMGPVASGVVMGFGLILVGIIIFLLAGTKIKD